MKKRIFLVCALFLFLSCGEDVLVRQGTSDGELMTATFSLATGAMEESLTAGTPVVGDGIEVSGIRRVATRVEAEEGLLAQEQVIGEVVVAQFNGITDAAVLVGTPQYVANYDDETFDATLTESSDPNTVVFIANTGNMTASITAGMTLAQLKALTHSVPDEIILENKDLPMVGMWTGAISIASLGGNNQIVKVPMQRVMAKVVLTVKSEVSDLTITKVHVNNVPTSVGLYTSKEATDFTTYTVTRYQGPLDERYIWYMPENVSTTTNTQVDIYATKEGKTYIYTTYLNTNGGNDYTVKRNTQYDLTVSIKRLTDAVTEADLTFDAHGEVYQLQAKDFAAKHIPDFTVQNYGVRGQMRAVSPLVKNSSLEDGANIPEQDWCTWIQMKEAGSWGTSWLSTFKWYGNFSATSSYFMHIYVNENLSSESRYAKMAVRYTSYYLNATGSTAQTTPITIILNVEQKGCTIVGPFGGYDSGTGTYTKQLVMEAIEENESPLSWTAAQSVCNTKFYNTADRNWYLPSQAQLAAMWIANYDSKNMLKDSYWSATDNSSNAWGIDMASGILKSENKSAVKKVRCVRDVDGTDI